VVALMTIDVHSRDVVEQLGRQRCTSAEDFTWQAVLRYQYDTDSEVLTARQASASFEYGYEYLGAQPRLVITPMTDRWGGRLTRLTGQPDMLTALRIGVMCAASDGDCQAEGVESYVESMCA
jgi:hypothetical protein